MSEEAAKEVKSLTRTLIGNSVFWRNVFTAAAVSGLSEHLGQGRAHQDIAEDAVRIGIETAKRLADLE